MLLALNFYRLWSPANLSFSRTLLPRNLPVKDLREPWTGSRKVGTAPGKTAEERDGARTEEDQRDRRGRAEGVGRCEMKAEHEDRGKSE